jgi:hypothetical protein
MMVSTKELKGRVALIIGQVIIMLIVALDSAIFLTT